MTDFGKKKGCSSCNKPKDEECGLSPAVLQINNPSECVMFHKVTIPASMGNEVTIPPDPGKYRNALVYYEASGNAYMYTSDGMPVLLSYTDYLRLMNKPTINGVTLAGDKSLEDLGIIINDGTLTLKSGGTALGSFTANATGSTEIYVKNIYTITLGQNGYSLNFNGVDIDDPEEAGRILAGAKAEEIKLAYLPSAVCYFNTGGRILNFISGEAEIGEETGPGAVVTTLYLNSHDGTYKERTGHIAFKSELYLQFLYIGSEESDFRPTGHWQLINPNPVDGSEVRADATQFQLLTAFLLGTQDIKGSVRAASYGQAGEALFLGEAYYDNIDSETVVRAELMSLKHQEIYSVIFKADETYTVTNRYKITTTDLMA